MWQLDSAPTSISSGSAGPAPAASALLESMPVARIVWPASVT